jgi:hypothetical protein
MDLAITTDSFGRLVCTVQDEDGPHAPITASDTVTATLELLAAVQDAHDEGYGECLWNEAAGQYRWMLRRHGARVTVVVLWSSGTVTGWQHVVHTETDFAQFAARVRAELMRTGERTS